MKIKVLSILITGCLFFACESSTDPDTEPELSATYIDSAKIALENVLYQLINDDNVEPADVDFSEPQRLFNLAYENDPKNPDANFGLALTNFLIINKFF